MMSRTVPALYMAGKASVRSLDFKAITPEHPLCARRWGQTGEETRGGQAGERESDSKLRGC